ERRARLEQVGDHAVAQLRAGEARAVVRVVRRHVGERENLAAAHVDHDHRARFRAMALDRALQRAEREALDLAVDRQREIAAVLGGADRLHVLDDAAVAIADHAPAAGLAPQGVLMRELDAFLARVVDPGKADYVSGYFTAGIVAPIFDVLVNALEAELLHRRRGLGSDLALEVDEVARAIAQTLVELDLLHREQRGELAPLAVAGIDVAGNCPHRFHRRRHRERFAVAIEHAPARGRNLHHARIARLALLLQEVGLHRLQPHRARGEYGEAGAEGNQHHACAPHGQAHQALRCLAHRPVSRPTRRTRRGSAARRPSERVASFSTRECSPQVLASSCRRPYSASSSRAAACSRSSCEKARRPLCCEVTSPSAQATRTARRRRFSFATARRARFGWVLRNRGPQYARPPGGWRFAPADFLLSLHGTRALLVPTA